MTGVPYPPKNCRIVFREPFPRTEYSPQKKYYIKAHINGMPEQEIRIDSIGQLRFIDELIAQDRKLLNAVVICKEGKFSLLHHSPQLDFFGVVK